MMNAASTTRGIAWVQVVIAAVAMVMTIPGRTQGLGLITEPVLADSSLQLDRTLFAWLNLLATLAGALFALPFGWLIDRIGVRMVLLINLLLLGLVTWGFSNASGIISFFAGMLLTRGLGQSALSTTSLTLVGKWFPDKLAKAMAIFSVISGIGFIVLFTSVGGLVKHLGWRETWYWLGLTLLAMGAFSWLFCRNPSTFVATTSKEQSNSTNQNNNATLRTALRSPIFWVFALSSALFNWVSSGIGLFNEDVLGERGFDKDVYIRALGTATFVTLLTNGLAGWLSTRWSLPRLMTIGMLLLAACLAILPYMTQEWHVYVNAVFLGSSAGMVMVVFFACWGTYFGREHLGMIQGCAQALTVLGSALGPVSLAYCKANFGTYQPLFLVLAGLAVLSAVALTMLRANSR